MQPAASSAVLWQLISGTVAAQLAGPNASMAIESWLSMAGWQPLAAVRKSLACEKSLSACMWLARPGNK